MYFAFCIAVLFQSLTCGAIALSPRRCPVNQNLPNRVLPCVTQNPTNEQKPDLWDVLPVAETLALTHFMDMHPTPP
ncbi:hypothetical protein GCM10027190_04000 [Spirosoma areae]